MDFVLDMSEITEKTVNRKYALLGTQNSSNTFRSNTKESAEVSDCFVAVVFFRKPLTRCAARKKIRRGQGCRGRHVFWSMMAPTEGAGAKNNEHRPN